MYNVLHQFFETKIMSEFLFLCFSLFPQVLKVKDEKKKEKKEDSEKTVRENIRKSLKEILTTRSV